MLAAVNRSATDVEELRNIIVDLLEAKGDPIAFSKLDIAFHQVLARAAGNPLIQFIIEGITDVALESSRTGLEIVTKDEEWSRILLLHENIAEAVIASSPSQSQTCMIAHFDYAWSLLNKK
jgi:DNA-binding FadR family transcriptional regulator